MNLPVAKGPLILSATLEISDADRAIAFYKALGANVGGKVEHPGVTEIIVMFPGGPVSLVLTKRKGATDSAPLQHGRVIIGVPDLHATQAQLEAAGFHLSHPIMEEKGFGLSVAGVADPDGNELELIQHG